MIALTAHPDRSLVRAAGHSTRYLRLRVVAPTQVAGKPRSPVHVAFVIDRSGSMAGTRLDLAKQATAEALGFLAATDRMTVVDFDDHVRTLVPPMPATYAAVTAARERVKTLEAGGSTALFEGWLTGCAHIDPATDAMAPTDPGPPPITRCLLLTDGHANVGETHPVTIAHHAAELRRRGVQTTTFGLGDGFSEDLLQAMASAGGGQFYFVEHPAQIRDFFTSELGETLEVTARDVAITVAHPAVRVEPMVAYAVDAPSRHAATVKLGHLSADQIVELVVKLTFPDGPVGDTIVVPIELTATGEAPVRIEVPFTFADHQANDRQVRQVEVDRLVATMYAAEARRAAVLDNRQGDYAKASKRLADTAKRVLGYAHGDAELLAIAHALAQDAKIYATAMDEISRKRAHHTSTSALKGRDASSGRARKSP